MNIQISRPTETSVQPTYTTGLRRLPLRGRRDSPVGLHTWSRVARGSAMGSGLLPRGFGSDGNGQIGGMS